MDPITQQQALAAAGAAGGDPVYVDDVFSTYLYEGNGTSQTITNGIDLSGEGGLVWIKKRSGADSHAWFDTERGNTSLLKSNTTDADLTTSLGITSFNSNGFSLGAGVIGTNANAEDIASWTFRKAPGFFDVVTYTGNGTSQNISHNLGSVPGMIVVKSLDDTYSWITYHRSLSSSEFLRLEGTNTKATSTTVWNDTAPTATQFTVGNSLSTNASGAAYVAYIFAHDDQSFGTGGDESVIKCGSYTVPSATKFDVDLGFEPQFVIVKRSSGTGATHTKWYVLDNMRGSLNHDGVSTGILTADTNESEASSAYNNAAYDLISAIPNGFRVDATSGPTATGTNGETYVYMAIRRPHKPPTAATEVFTPDLGSVDPAPNFTANHVSDLVILHKTTGTYAGWTARFNDGKYLRSDSTSAEGTSGARSFVGQYGFGNGFGADSNFIAWMFKRAPGFFDIVAYEGNGTAGHAVSHNLEVAPELMIIKRRDTTNGWGVYSSVTGASQLIYLNATNAATSSTHFNNTAPTATTFTLGTQTLVNASGSDYFAYLFASLDGISKVGSYTGTGSDINVDCGFTAGARFVLIKRTDSTGAWYVWDTARGIIAGNDPYLLLNSSAAEVTNTDYIDPLNAGFTVTSTAPADLNTSGGTYIFLAIA